MAVNAQVGLLYFWRMISFGIETFGKFEHISGAILYAEAAPLASFLYYINLPL